MGGSKKTKGKAKEARAEEPAPIVAVRKMTGPAVRNLITDRADARARVRCGWQPLGVIGDRVVLVADEQADAAWAAGGRDDRRQAEDQ